MNIKRLSNLKRIKIIKFLRGGDIMEMRKETTIKATPVSKNKRDKLSDMLINKHKAIYERLAK